MQGGSSRTPGAWVQVTRVIGSHTPELREGTRLRPWTLQESHRASQWCPGTAGSFSKRPPFPAPLPSCPGICVAASPAFILDDLHVGMAPYWVRVVSGPSARASLLAAD
ncbi:uncharacterized protein LOC114670535 [Macaca mulatta]